MPGCRRIRPARRQPSTSFSGTASRMRRCSCKAIGNRGCWVENVVVFAIFRFGRFIRGDLTETTFATMAAVADR